jgi:hypothetical protein
MDRNELHRALRGIFEARVMNHGDYSLVLGRSSGTGAAVLIGYRHTPLELLVCPVDPERLSRLEGNDDGDGVGGSIRGADPVVGIDLTNVATVADTGTGYDLLSVTGSRIAFEVDVAPWLATGGPEGAGVALDQARDAEDFHQFMDHFMDTLDGFYAVPDTAETLQGTYALTC